MEVRQFVQVTQQEVAEVGIEAFLFDIRAVDGVRPLQLNPYDSLC